MRYTVGTKTHCEAVQAAADKLMGYPRLAKGGAAFTGDAVKVAADALLLTGQADFVPRPGPDVSLPHYAGVRRHPTYSNFAFPITQDFEDKYVQDSGDGLSLDEDELLFDAIDGAQELPPSWDADVPKFGG